MYNVEPNIRIIITLNVFSRLILIAEKDTVYEKFPTPLINRLEKHFVLTSSVLNKWQEILLKNLDKWVQDFSNPRYTFLIMHSYGTMIGLSFVVAPNTNRPMLLLGSRRTLLPLWFSMPPSSSS